MSMARGTLLVISLMASGAAYAGTPGWSVSEVSGPVFVGKPGLSKTSTVTRGAALSAGDIVSTGKGGRAVIVRGGEYLTVAPNTQLQLTEPKAGAFTQIVQSFGNVVFKIQKKTTPHFQVKTPYLAAVVKGTTFSVTVTPAGASVQVTEGLVQVASLDGLVSRFVSPGEIGMIAASAPGQLSVLGTPNAPSGGAAVIGAVPVADAQTSETQTEPTAAPISEIAEVRIASPIGEGSVNLAAQTGGIVSGNSSLAQAAIVEAVAIATPVATNTSAPAEVSAAVAEAPVPDAAPPALETPANLLAEAPVSLPTPSAVSEVEAQPPVEVAIVTPPPVEQAAPPAELPVEVAMITAPPVEQAAPPLEPPVEVAMVTAPVLAETAPAMPVVETPPTLFAEVAPSTPAVETPPAVVAEAPPAPAVVDTPTTIVAEVTPPAPTLGTPPAVVAEAPPAPAVVAAPPALVAEATSTPAIIDTPAAQPPVLVAELTTPGNRTPVVPDVAAGNANLGNGNGNGNAASAPAVSESPPAQQPVVAAASPIAPVPPTQIAPEAAAPVLVAVNNSPTPVEGAANPTPPASLVAVNNANSNSAIADNSPVEAPKSDTGGEQSKGDNSSATKGTAVASNPPGQKNNRNPLTLSELLQRLQVAGQQLAASRKGN